MTTCYIADRNNQIHSEGYCFIAHDDASSFRVQSNKAESCSGHPRRLPPPSSVDENAVKVVAGAVLLQRGLRTSNLEFVEGEVRVLQDAPAAAADSESSSGAREGVGD